MKRLLPTLAVCLFICLFNIPAALAQETVYAESLGSVTLSELEGLGSLPPVPREVEHVSRRSLPVDVWRAQPSAAAWEAAPAATIARPPIVTSFESIGSGQLSPGDASGAIGRNHVVTATNAGVIVHTRSGVASPPVALQAFLSDLFTDNGIYTDPRIAYDSANDRWIVFGLRYPSYALLCVSQTGDPRGAWMRYRLTIDSHVGSVDFTRLALTRDTIVAMTYDDLYSYAFSIRKSDLYALPATLPATLRQITSWDAVPVTGEESPVEYVLFDDSPDILVSRLDQLSLPAKRAKGATPWSRSDSPAPQLGGIRPIDTGFFDIDNAVLRGGNIYVVHSVSMSGPRRTAVVWWKIQAETGARLGGGILDDPAGGKFYAYPSVAVNRSGAMMIGFATFSSTQYPSAGYVYVDANGAMSSEGALKSGTTPITSTRWGDYTATVVDPADETSFWSVQLAGVEGHWVTWWGRISTKVKTRAARH